jgi:hypothetical protein
MSRSEEEDFQEELRLAGNFGPGNGPLFFDGLNDEFRVVLAQFH